MKKILFITFILLILFSINVSARIVINSSVSSSCFDIISNTTWVAQTFTLNGTYALSLPVNLTAISLYLVAGTPPSFLNQTNYTVVLTGVNSSGDVPSSPVPLSYAKFNGSRLNPADGFVNITMPSIILNNSQKYAIILNSSAGSDVRWGAACSDTLLGGDYYKSANNGSSWQKFPNLEASFIVYGNGVNFIENSQTFNPTTTSGTREYFVINISYDSSYYTSITATLIYNNTQFSPTQTGSGNNLVFNASLIVPLVGATTNKSFYWQFILNNGTTSEYYNSTFNNQTISPLSIDNCSSFTQQILNFTLFDEDARTTLNGTIELIVDLFTLNTENRVTTLNLSYNYIANGNPLRVCLQTLNSTYNMNYHARYFSNVSLYVVENKFAQRLNVSNTTATQNVNLYDLLDARSTAFTITLTSADLSTIQNAIIDVHRQYVPINQFISVESPLTDNLGKTVAHLVAEEVYYNFIVMKNGTVLGTFNNYLVQCQNVVTGDCRINLNLIQSVPDLPDFTNYGNITGTFTWLPSARQLAFTFVSTDGLTHNVSWGVFQADNWGNTTICSNSAISTSGTFTCTIPALYGNSSIYADIFSDNHFLGRSGFSFLSNPGNVFGGTRVVLAVLMYTTLTLLFIANPAMIIIGSIIGMIFAAAFHVVDGGTFIGNTSIIIWFVIAGLIIIYYMRNKT